MTKPFRDETHRNLPAGRVSGLKGLARYLLRTGHLVMQMNVIYNSDNYYVVEYSPKHGFELVDKQTQRGAFFQGDIADKFAQSLRDVVGEDGVSMERVDEFLGGFDDLMNQPVLYH
jgi:hypothetical protein